MKNKRKTNRFDGRSEKKTVKRGPTYWMYGTHAVQAALANPQRVVRRVLATKPVAERLAVEAEIVESERLERLLPQGAVHQGLAAEVEPLDEPLLETLMQRKLTLAMLDQITDPQNVGAIWRSAAAFGIGGILMPKDHAAPESGVLAKAASGALECVPGLHVTNLAATIKELKNNGYWIAGLDGGGSRSIDAAKDYAPLCLVLGAEGRGLRRLTGEHCDVILSIPIDPQMESLNVANAAAIAFYCATRS